MAKHTRAFIVAIAATVAATLFIIAGCNESSSSSSSSTGGGTGSSATLIDNAAESDVTSVTTAYGGTCEKVSRDVTSCNSARTALGFTGNWLLFSCNVTLGLVNSSGDTVTDFSSASYVTVTFYDLPDYLSNYYPTTGTYSFTANDVTVTGDFDDLYSAYSTTFPDPGSIGSVSTTLKIPIITTPATSGGTDAMELGMVGVALNGVAIFDNLANSTDNIFTEAGSFDQCQGHPAGSTYHYHSEPYSLSYNDNNVIGIMRDGYWIYGRQDSDTSTPGSIANIETAGTSSTIYKYGGHVGTDPITGTGSSFHYHLTEWIGCYHESGGTKSTDDGQSDDSLDTGISVTCTSDGGTWVDAWFMTGRGNGGVFETIPSGLTHQAPGQTVAGARYYWGTHGSCTGTGCGEN